MQTTLAILLLAAGTAAAPAPGLQSDSSPGTVPAEPPDTARVPSPRSTAGAPTAAAARARSPRRPPGAIVIPRLSGPIQLDGLSNEPAWSAVEPLPAVGHAPAAGAEPSERTEFRVAHDGQFLYAAGRMYDAQPAGIRATTLRRDEGSFSNDWFAVNLDTFHDGETILTFATNPAGVRTDVVYVNDAQNGADFNWNALWDAAVRQTDQGWFAEIRIPLSSLRFQEQDGEVVMGMTVRRRIARKNETITFPSISPQWGWTSPFKASQAQPVVLEGVHSRNPLRATPYLLAGGGNAHHPRADGTGYQRARQRIGELGLDVKYGLTSNLTLDVTVNPDFAQVEADDSQLNLSRFSVFFPEKRLFFQERAGVFAFPIGRTDRLFHSRRIGLSDGVPVPLHGGARLVGRAGAWDIGAMAMHAGSGEAAHHGVLRLRRTLLNAGSYLGAIATLQSGAGRDLAHGVDGRLRVHAEDYLAFQLAQTHSTEPGATASAGDRTFARLFWERRGRDGLTYALDLARSGAAFDPALGFLSRHDYTKLGGHVAYGWRPGPASRLLRHEVGVAHLGFWSASGGELESRRITTDWRAETKAGRELVVGLHAEREELAADLSLSPEVAVPAGSYAFANGFLSYASPGGSPRRVALNADGGGFYDGWQATVRLAQTWNASRHLELSALAQLSHLEMPARDGRLTARIARLRARAMLDTRLSASTFVQYSSAQGALGANLRLHYNPREGDDLYLVYNAGINAAVTGPDPLRPRLDSQVLMLKYSRTMGIGG